MKFIIDREKYIDTGLVSEKEHDIFPLKLYNYTQNCQFSKQWDDVTMMCRGLIVNKNTNEIVAYPFKKFFNYEEHINNGDKIPSEKPKVYCKFDGSLGILYWFDGNPYIATRGSFNSEQAQWATNFINRPDILNWVNKLDKTKTYLFEIIYPENKIVLSYNFSGLVHLATIDTNTGKSCSIDSDFPMATEIEFTTIDKLKSLNTKNEEGFVLHYPQSDFRMKIKFEEYVKLHKIITGLSEIGIWEMLRDDTDPLKNDVPDEMFKWLEKVITDLRSKFEEIEMQGIEAYRLAKKYQTRKEQAEVIKQAKNPSIAFAMLDGKDYKQIIWKMIRPKGSNTFRKDIDA